MADRGWTGRSRRCGFSGTFGALGGATSKSGSDRGADAKERSWVDSNNPVALGTALSPA
ncbi:MAG: hypothetical protein HC890_09605 [Chloroflexaceae bacterium]|nr:hypothetical protein [Chloroflexaceae bacterium]